MQRKWGQQLILVGVGLPREAEDCKAEREEHCVEADCERILEVRFVVTEPDRLVYFVQFPAILAQLKNLIKYFILVI
jgi:hypothetical protein